MDGLTTRTILELLAALLFVATAVSIAMATANAHRNHRLACAWAYLSVRTSLLGLGVAILYVMTVPA